MIRRKKARRIRKDTGMTPFPSEAIRADDGNTGDAGVGTKIAGTVTYRNLPGMCDVRQGSPFPQIRGIWQKNTAVLPNAGKTRRKGSISGNNNL